MTLHVNIDEDELKQAITNGDENEVMAKKFGTSLRTISRRKASLARQGWSPQHDLTHQVPDGFHMRGASTLYDKDGKIKIQWVKSNIDHARQMEIMREAVNTMSEEIPKEPNTPRVSTTSLNSKLANCYIITDYHMGLMAWGEETGADWDLKIAEDMLVDWFKTAIDQSPNAEVGIFAQLADFLHWDGMEAVTPQHKNILDADSRFQKLVRVAIKAIRRIIRMLLEKHERVVLIQPGGNHDPASTVWLREMFHALYEDHDRVFVDRNADLYACYEHGNTSLFFHHGHKRKIGNIDDVFAAKYREIWGRTKFSYGHMGHLHSDELKETSLMLIERHRTLAAPDAYAANGGWMSGRSAKCITYSSEYGEVGRITITPEMLK